LSRLYVVLILLGIVAVGVIRLISRCSKLAKNHAFAETYLKTLQQYVASQGQDNNAYSWLVRNSNKMQRESGYFGIIDYRPPASTYVIHNYQIILNMLPELRRSLNRSSLSGDYLSPEYSALLQETLIRHMGDTEERLEDTKKQLINPFVWLQEGVKGILLIPLSVVEWTGLTGPNVIARFSDSLFFRIVSGIVTLLGLVASAVSIVVGWERFISVIQRLLSVD